MDEIAGTSNLRSSSAATPNAESNIRDQFRKAPADSRQNSAGFLSRKSTDKASEATAPVPLPVQHELENEGTDVDGLVSRFEEEEEEAEVGEEQDGPFYAQAALEEAALEEVSTVFHP